jgi:hypothetical protein
MCRDPLTIKPLCQLKPGPRICRSARSKAELVRPFLLRSCAAQLPQGWRFVVPVTLLAKVGPADWMSFCGYVEREFPSEWLVSQ